MVEPTNFFLFLTLFIAFSSACGRPDGDVLPEEIIFSFLTITQPTGGFIPVDPLDLNASSIAYFIHLL